MATRGHIEGFPTPATRRRALNGGLVAAATAAFLLVATPATAQIVEGTDTTPAVVDMGLTPRTIAISSDGIVTDVDIVVDFAKIDDGGLGSCEPLASGGGAVWNEELSFALTSPTGTVVSLIAAGTYFDIGYGGRVQVHLDDEAPGTLSGLPATGTFRPTQPLSVFDGETAAGNWILTAADSTGGDPLCYFGARLLVDANVAPDASDSTATTTAEVAVPITLSATDADGDALTFAIDSVGGIGGTVVCTPTGGSDCVYTPPAGSSGTALIAFSASDGWQNGSAVVTVTVNAAPAPSPAPSVAAAANELPPTGAAPLLAVALACAAAGVGALLVEGRRRKRTASAR
ncbi:Ig-like domain-containing protein [Protaetiibacter sp. SSC-01]|uniref:Ig-like domain-containing protein n=1 Tax=Protaetiibacter sp. SSC-01 TaxID=2759943 RepID=UPI0016575DB5|nr:Ig-like domain-containing protein [Protaetiibacter sp. SSC-01]QNO37433.1 Ig-like domain-containing protein [Protaetiibacter sp. SSC-01]